MSIVTKRECWIIYRWPVFLALVWWWWGGGVTPIIRRRERLVNYNHLIHSWISWFPRYIYITYDEKWGAWVGKLALLLWHRRDQGFLAFSFKHLRIFFPPYTAKLMSIHWKYRQSMANRLSVVKLANILAHCSAERENMQEHSREPRCALMSVNVGKAVDRLMISTSQIKAVGNWPWSPGKVRIQPPSRGSEPAGLLARRMYSFCSQLIFTKVWVTSSCC